MCGVKEYSDITGSPRKEAKGQTCEKCGGVENISDLGKNIYDLYCHIIGLDLIVRSSEVAHFLPDTVPSRYIAIAANSCCLVVRFLLPSKRHQLWKDC